MNQLVIRFFHDKVNQLTFQTKQKLIIYLKYTIFYAINKFNYLMQVKSNLLR